MSLPRRRQLDGSQQQALVGVMPRIADQHAPVQRAEACTQLTLVVYLALDTPGDEAMAVRGRPALALIDDANDTPCRHRVHERALRLRATTARPRQGASTQVGVVSRIAPLRFPEWVSCEQMASKGSKGSGHRRAWRVGARQSGRSG